MSPFDRPVRALSDLSALWNHIDGGHGYGAGQLFALHLDAAGIVQPAIIQVYDEQEVPDEELFDLLMDRLGEVLAEAAPDGSVAIMRARPGAATMTELDHAWCRALHRAQRRAPFATHPLFFATDHSVGPVPSDVLVECN